MSAAVVHPPALNRPSPVLDYGLAADLDGAVRERRGEPVAAVVRSTDVAVLPDSDADRPRDDRILHESRERLRVQAEPDRGEHVLAPGSFYPVRLRELHVLL